MRKAVAQLSPRDREIIVLRFFEEKSYDEIADILRIPRPTAATRLRRAKRRLHELLKDVL